MQLNLEELFRFAYMLNDEKDLALLRTRDAITKALAVKLEALRTADKPLEYVHGVHDASDMAIQIVREILT